MAKRKRAQRAARNEHTRSGELKKIKFMIFKKNFQKILKFIDENSYIFIRKLFEENDINYEQL